MDKEKEDIIIVVLKEEGDVLKLEKALFDVLGE